MVPEKWEYVDNIPLEFLGTRLTSELSHLSLQERVAQTLPLVRHKQTLGFDCHCHLSDREC